MSSMFARFILLLALLLPATAAAGTVAVIDVDGVIGPATSDHFKRSLAEAVEMEAEALVVRLDTPGGLDSAMREMIRAIIGAPLPVISYVSPSGARAASAGTYILYASHVAAMAPATNLGAATPVQIGGMPGKDQPAPGEEGDSKPVADSPMERKLVNDAVAYIRGLAEMRGRNAEWAEKAVREAASLSSARALEMQVIDLVAADLEALLREVDGREVALQGQTVRLETAEADVVVLEQDWRNKLLAVITDPNVAYVLMLIGIYGLFFELANPGAMVPGVLGGICLVLALFAFQALPINYAGLALILLGLAFIVGEAFVPSFGVLGIGGVVAFVIGSVILMDTDSVGFEISLGLIAGFAVFSLVALLGIAALAIRSHGRPAVTGGQMVGSEGEVLRDFLDHGQVRVHGEIWSAVSEVPLLRGDRVRVVSRDGLRLRVEPLDRGEAEAPHLLE